MKRTFWARITILCLLLSMLSSLVLPASAASVTYARSMTTSSAAGTYYVATAADLAQMATLVNAGMTMKGYTFLQTQNINLSGVNYTPIGWREEPSVTTTSFQGTYDGQRYKISNLTYSDTMRDGAGLFGSAYKATLMNIGIESGSVTAANRAGGVAGYADGCTVINCYNKADITIVDGTDGVGGIAGVARSTSHFYGCYNTGTITCATTGAGGIVGWGGKGDNTMLIGCYSAGALKSSETLSTSSYALDVIARNTTRTMGDFSSCYYLAGIYKDAEGNDLSATYNNHDAIRLDKADNERMAYVMNHATGANTNAFTIKSGKIVFSASEQEGVTDLRIKAIRDGVMLNDTGIVRTIAGGYTVPSTYNSYTVTGATVGGTGYAVGDFIPSETADILTVELTLKGNYPSVADYASNESATIFTVSTAAELATLAELVDSGITFAGKTVYVTADLDFSAYNSWNGIGHATGSGGGNVSEGSLPFSGTFDGQYHHFKNINFRQNTTYSAIFSHTANATLRNIILDEGTIHCVGSKGRLSGVLGAVLSNTLVENIENHVSVYAEQEEVKANNLGMVALPLDGTVINNCVNYGEVGLAGKANLQDNGSFVGWGYGEATVKNCLAVGVVYGESSNPVARGCTTENNYYLPHGETAGTMTYEMLLSGEAAQILNDKSGLAIWSKGEKGPTLDPDHPVVRATYRMYVTDGPALQDQVVYQNAGQMGSLPAYIGYTTLNESEKFWPLTNTYMIPWDAHSISVYYSQKSYTIDYVTNGGRFSGNPATTAISGTAKTLPTATDIERTGYAFAGWYTNPELTGKPVTETPVDVFHKVTYYAGWTKATKISTAKQLAAMKTNGHYILTADINMSGVSFAPIGTYDVPFTGTLDGNGHTISGLNINSTQNYQGLFGVNKGAIRNVTLDDDCTIKGNAYVGGIAGENLGTIENCISRAAVSGASSQSTVDFTLFVQNMRVASPIPAARLTAMKERIDTCDPDLMLLQEANAPWISFLETNYTSTGKYSMVYKYRSTNSLEAVPVLYKKSKFTLIESGNFWLSKTPDVESAPEGYSHYRICTWVALKEKATGRYILAFSVHLDNSTNEVKTINAQALKDRFDTIRKKYASYDPVCIVGGDFNSAVGTDPYNALVSDDMVNTIYEITTGLTPARIDHILISENNVRASDKTFEYLPVIDAANEIPSDHAGLYTRLLGLVKSRIGGIAGSNSGVVKNCVGQGTVGGSYNYGTLVGRNLATVENSHYKLQSGISPLGITVDTTAPGEITSNAATVYAINTASVLDRYTLKSGEIALTSAGEELACVTNSGSNASHSYGKAKTVNSCIEGNYTVKTCSVCGYECRTAIADAAGHSYGALTTYNDESHKRTCTVCKKVEYLDHSFTAQDVAATCEAYGATRYSCDCGYYYDEINDDQLSHIWSSFAQLNAEEHQLICQRDATHTLKKAHTLTTTPVDATCEEAGGDICVCADCGYNVFVASIDPLGHSYGAWTPLDAKNHQAVCKNDSSHVKTAAHEVTLTAVVDPTCEEKGYTRYTCADCGYYYDTDYVDALGHTYAYDAEQMAYVCHCGGIYVTDGDLDGDGLATTADIVLLLRRIDGWQGEIPDYAADVNGDGQIKIYDAIRFLQILNS